MGSSLAARSRALYQSLRAPLSAQAAPVPKGPRVSRLRGVRAHLTQACARQFNAATLRGEWSAEALKIATAAGTRTSVALCSLQVFRVVTEASTAPQVEALIMALRALLGTEGTRLPLWEAGRRRALALTRDLSPQKPQTSPPWCTSSC